MSKIKPHLRESLLKGISKPTAKQEHEKFHFVISFKHLDKNQGQKFEEWESDKILARALDTLASYCNSTLEEQCGTKKFRRYSNFPGIEDTDFTFPSHVPPDAEWARIHITGKQIVAGHIFRNVFYVVFLDKNHQFWKTPKD